MHPVSIKRIRRWFRQHLRRLLGRPAKGRGGGRGGKRRKRKKRAPTALGQFGARVGRHTGIYGAGQGGSLLLGLVSLAVLTRFLDPATFGQYALYYFFTGLLSVLYTLGWVRGSLLWVFGAGGDDDDDDDDADSSDGKVASAEDKRRALGSAVVFVALIALVGTLVVAALAGPLAELLTGAGEGRLALLAGAAGAATAVWMLAGAIPRRERRPQTFVVVSLARPLLVLVATVPLVAIDPTVEAAVLGLAIGAGAAALLALVAVRRSFTFALGANDVRNIARLGMRYAPLIVSLWVIANGGVFFLGQYASAADAGFFRIATGVAAVASLPVTAFITAWGPLRREPIYGAVEAERGKMAAAGVLATYFALAAIGIFLGLAVGADLLVRIAPGAYADAAPLIPLIGLGFLLRGWFRVLRRSAKFPQRWLWYVWLSVAAAVVFVAACILLIPPLDTYGAALAVVAAFLAAAVVMSLRSQLGREPIPFALGRILGGVAIAAGCYAVTKVLELEGAVAVVVDFAALLAYPLLLAATGVVPRAHMAPLRSFAAAALPSRSPSANGGVKLDGLDEPQRAMLELLVRHRRPPQDVAPLVGVPRRELESRFVGVLRHVGGIGAPGDGDAGIGAYLLSSAPVAVRDQLWRRLSAQGVDALEVDALSLTLERLRRAPDKAWPTRGPGTRE